VCRHIYNGLRIKKWKPLRKQLVGECGSCVKNAGFSSAEAFAERLGVHPNTVSELERGDNWLSPEMLEKMSDALKIGPERFFTDSTPKPTLQEALEIVNRAALASEHNRAIVSVPAPVRELIALTSSLNEKEMSHLLDTIRAFLVDTRGPQSGTVLHTFHAPQKKSKR
jgi:transcriptional regulator with XRE-family HTH domain